MTPEQREKQREYRRRWYEKNREKAIAQAKAWSQANPERANASKRKWREANPEKQRASVKRSVGRPEYQAHRREYYREWRANNPDKIAVYAWRSNQRRRGINDLRSSDYAQVLWSDPCSYCDGPGGEVDHITSVEDGGGAGFENLTAACRSCNASKQTKPLLTFLLDHASLPAVNGKQ